MTQATFERHPLSLCFGDMDEEEFQHFKSDIEAHGQHEPVLMFEGMILDGWHRYLAATQLGREVQKFTFTGTYAEAQERVISSNDKRRHRTVAQRAQAIVAVTACRPVGRPEERNSAPGAELSKAAAPTAKKIAAAHGIGTRSVERARVIDAAGLGPLVVDGALSGKEAEQVALGKSASRPAPKPAAPTKTPAPAPASVDQVAAELAETKEAVRILAEDNDRLADRLAVEAMDASEEEKLKAAATIAELRAELKTANAELKAVRAVRDDYMRENGQMKKTIESLQRKLKKLEAVA